MKELFCSYEQSLALKELGFDEPCICVYDNKNIHRVEQGDNSVLFLTVINKRLPDKFCAAPLKSQVFKWFRDKYNYCHFIRGNNYDGFYYDIDNLGLVRYEIEIDNRHSWKTYEEAEDACIDKLIEICKNEIHN